MRPLHMTVWRSGQPSGSGSSSTGGGAGPSGSKGICLTDIAVGRPSGGFPPPPPRFFFQPPARRGTAVAAISAATAAAISAASGSRVGIQNPVLLVQPAPAPVP